MKNNFKKNIFDNLPFTENEEFFETIFKNSNVKIERIISNGYVSPENFWYNQDKYEFVILVEGFAALEFEGNKIELKKGDYLIIEPRRKHRVARTSESAVWLCIFFK